MKYLYKGFALGFIIFSGFAFAAEDDSVNVSEKPINEEIDTSFVEAEIFVAPEEETPIKGEEIFIKDEYYDNLEDNIFYTTDIKTKDDTNEGTIYTLDMIKRTTTDGEPIGEKPDIIDGGEFVEAKPDVLYDEDGAVIKPEPPFIEDSEGFPIPPIMTVGGGELPESEWVYMTANTPPYVYQTAVPTSSSGNISVSEPFALMALLSACVAFVSVKRRKEI